MAQQQQFSFVEEPSEIKQATLKMAELVSLGVVSCFLLVFSFLMIINIICSRKYQRAQQLLAEDIAFARINQQVAVAQQQEESESDEPEEPAQADQPRRQPEQD